MVDWSPEPAKSACGIAPRRGSAHPRQNPSHGSRVTVGVYVRFCSQIGGRAWTRLESGLQVSSAGNDSVSLSCGSL
jgi:hypothetical protein